MNNDFRLMNSAKRVNSNFFILFLLFLVFSKIKPKRKLFFFGRWRAIIFFTLIGFLNIFVNFIFNFMEGIFEP